MANQRGTFAKRNREMKLKDRARDKAERLAARRSEGRETKGPEIAWNEAGGVGSTERDSDTGTASDVTPAPSTNTDSDR